MRFFSIAYWIFLWLMCIPFFAIALVVFVLTVPFDRRRVILHLYSCFWGTFYLYANPIWHVRVEGRRKLPWRAPVVIVANHASIIDILVLFSLYRPFKWVSKAENFKLPFIGWNMTLNDYVPLVRGSKASILKMMEECKRHLAGGTPVLMFPEGTRTRTGELLEFKDGAFLLAKEVGCPIVPIAVHGTRHSLPTRGIILRNGMNARVEVLEPIQPDGLDATQLRDAAKQAIAKALARASEETEGAQMSPA